MKLIGAVSSQFEFGQQLRSVDSQSKHFPWKSRVKSIGHAFPASPAASSLTAAEATVGSDNENWKEMIVKNQMDSTTITKTTERLITFFFLFFTAPFCRLENGHLLWLAQNLIYPQENFKFDRFFFNGRINVQSFSRSPCQQPNNFFIFFPPTEPAPFVS